MVVALKSLALCFSFPKRATWDGRSTVIDGQGCFLEASEDGASDAKLLVHARAGVCSLFHSSSGGAFPAMGSLKAAILPILS